MMRKLALLAILLAAPALAEPQDAPLAGALGVQVEKPAGDHLHFSHGSGVYLGNGLVLTAAHVVKYDPAHPTASVMLDGWKTEAALVAMGQGVDLALLKIDPADLSRERRDIRPLDVCSLGTTPNQLVTVAKEGTVTQSKTIGTAFNSPSLKGDWSNIVALSASPGSSGGGVFDALKGCLAGIIIIGVNDPSVELFQFVPAPEIAMFLAGKR